MAEQLIGAILAAGRGERLRPSVGGIPKPLVYIDGEPMLFRQIRTIQQTGISTIHVIVNSETRALMETSPLKSPGGVDWLIRDTANSMESLLALGERLGPGRFLLSTVDAVLSKHELRRFVANATKIAGNKKTQLDGVLGVVRCDNDSHPLFVQVAPDGVITRLGGAKTPLVTAGIYLFDTAIFAWGDEARRRGLDAMRRFLAMLVETGNRFAALELEQAVDVDDGSSLAAARAMLARRSE